ncbi:hypothetical protein [Pseudoalteromonas xiamenensis]|uniref:Uncharacterized protein n=1 Tax=Pseudoalteromonas xiamenensis TaxID=882626 RepID=A0A975DN43_9GAMM|nr:hypothetical protein [Pseudoalteromonas xiamenensis]QTH73446.1 hypothetical protein J5O05_18275 [Pseudoalteromonas xiamenensis]WMN61788.1 hypothetical protein NI389_18440 [Pseudoalteromonas xiamenensis]
MKKGRTVHPLVSQLTFAIFAAAILWLLATDKDILVVGNALILVYVVYALASCVVRAKDRDKKHH